MNIAVSLTERIKSKLNAAFQPVKMDLVDDSARHHGHREAGQPGMTGSESHFILKMTSPVFAGKNRLERQRAVNEVLRDEMKQQIHALSMDLKSPDEG